jgi:hypothetical protein
MDLKGHAFSRAAPAPIKTRALATEDRELILKDLIFGRRILKELP